MIAVRFHPPSRAVIEAFRTFLEGMPEVISIFVLTGNDDFLVHVAVRTPTICTQWSWTS